MKFIPLPDNDKNTINKIVEEIYLHIEDSQKNLATKEELPKFTDVVNRINDTTQVNWFRDEWGRASTDSAKITVLAKLLNLIS